jgi:hypothetical protein
MPTKIRVDPRVLLQLGERFDALSAILPAVRRTMMTEIGTFARAQLVSTYELDLPSNPMLGYNLPSVYRGTFGRSIRLFVTPQGTVTIRADATGTGIDTGLPPRVLSDTEREEVREWAETKMGVSSAREVNAIIRKLETFGVIGRRIFDDAFGRDTPRGQVLDRFIGAALDRHLNQMLNDAGFNQ